MTLSRERQGITCVAVMTMWPEAVPYPGKKYVTYVTNQNMRREIEKIAREGERRDEVAAKRPKRNDARSTQVASIVRGALRAQQLEAEPVTESLVTEVMKAEAEVTESLAMTAARDECGEEGEDKGNSINSSVVKKDKCNVLVKFIADSGATEHLSRTVII